MTASSAASTASRSARTASGSSAPDPDSIVQTAYSTLLPACPCPVPCPSPYNRPSGGSMPHAASGLGAGPDWRSALDQAIEAARLPRCDLALLFVSSHFREHEPEILAAVRKE